MEGRRAALHPLLTRSHHLTNLANKYAGDTPQSERDTRTFRRDHLWNPGFVTVTSYTPGRSPPRPATASERLSPAFTVVDAAKPPSRSSIVAPNASGRPDNESRISTTTAFMLGTLGQMRLDEHAAIDARMRAHAVAAVSDWAQRCRRVDVDLLASVQSPSVASVILYASAPHAARSGCMRAAYDNGTARAGHGTLRRVTETVAIDTSLATQRRAVISRPAAQAQPQARLHAVASARLD